MINLGLRCGQLLAEKRRGMNIIEQSAFWFQYERDSQSPREEEIDHSIEETPLEPERTNMYIVNQLRADNVNLRKQWYEHLKEDREYRANAKKKSNIYKYK